MQYWIEGISEPLTLNQIYAQRQRIAETTRCAPVGTNEWRSIKEVIPTLFDGSLPPQPESVNPAVSSVETEFSRTSGWETFFYALAGINFISGFILAFFMNPALAFIAGMSSVCTCLFFAFISRVLVDIRWLLSRK